MENVLGKNRKSPQNEADYIRAYKEMNKTANKTDNLDIAAVTRKNGEKGHGLILEALNRGHDNKIHRVKDFIPDSELKKHMR